MKKSTCCTCGYQWPTGQNGSHQCSIELLSKIEDMAKALQGIKDIVVGESSPYFSSHMHTTRTRMKIADICDAALSHKESARESQILYVAERVYDYEGFQIIGLYSTEAAAQKACSDDKDSDGDPRGDDYDVEGFKVQD